MFTGAKAAGGFCVTRRGLLLSSKLSHILTDNPILLDYSLPEGRLIPYKGRQYGWLPISPEGLLRLSEETLGALSLEPGMELMAIRSSNIAFTLGAKGPLLERAGNFQGEIPVY